MKLRLRRTVFAGALALGCAFLTTACGGPEVGEECDEVGSSTECEDGAVCTNHGDEAVCRSRCAEQDDCPPGFACNGVSGTNVKSCQPG